MWRDNNLSIVLVALFLLCMAGHAYSGWLAYNDEQRQHAQPEISLSAFVRSSEFGETVFENWESEFLQMGFYVVLTVFLYQKGSSESKKHDGTDEVEEDPLAHRDDPHVPRPVKAGGWRLALYKNSLSLAFLALFLVSFWGHAASGARQHNKAQREHGASQQVTTIGYVQTPQFWYPVVSELAKRVPGSPGDCDVVDLVATVGLAGVQAGSRVAFGDWKQLITCGLAHGPKRRPPPAIIARVARATHPPESRRCVR